MHAIVLAGGFGTRLQVVCPHVPKPMAPIAGKPFLAYLLDYLILQGFQSVTLSVHYLADVIQSYFKDYYHLSSVNHNNGLNINYSHEPKALGTGGALRQALSILKKTDQPIWMMNGDSFFMVDYQAMFALHQQKGSLLTMALKQVSDCSRYGKVNIADHRVVHFEEKGQAGPGYINGGVYLSNGDLFNHTKLSESFSFESDFLQPRLSHIHPSAFTSDGYFIDIGIPSDYDRAQTELPQTLSVLQAIA